MQPGWDLIMFYPPWVLSSSFFLSFFSICFSTVLAPHFYSLPCVALAATYQIPNLETQPVFFHEGKRNTIADAERTPSLYSFNPVSLDDVAAQSSQNRACVRLLRQVNLLHDIHPRSPVFLPFNVEISYFESNVLGITFVVWQEQWEKWQQKEKKSVKEFEPPMFCFEHIR